MQKVWKHGAAILRRMIWLGMALQVILGACWILNNMGTEHHFGVDWSNAGPVDRPFMQWGPMYPLIVKAFMGMARWTHIPYYSLLYCLQLAVACGCGWFLLGQVTGWRWKGRIGGALVLLSVPFALQSHLAILPYSLTGSAILLELAFGIALYRRDKWRVRDLVPMLASWLAAILLMPEYLWLGAIPVVFLVIRHLWRTGKQCSIQSVLGVVVPVVVVCVAAAGIWGLQKEEQLSFRQMVVAKCSWSDIYSLYNQWSPEIQELIDIDTLKNTGDNPEIFWEGFFDGFARLTKEQSNAYLDRMLEVALKTGGKRLLVEIAYDGVGYLFPGTMLAKQLEGEGFISLTGMNYWNFTRNVPSWSGFYMRWYCCWFWISAIAALLVKLFDGLCTGRGIRALLMGREWKMLGAGGLMAVAAACFYTISRIGVFDYKIMLWWTVLWYTITLMMTEEQKRDGEQNDTTVTN